MLEAVTQQEPDFTPRQRAVLAAALDLLVEKGERALTTAGIARHASCSKESLYKWFGDRDGILAAVISFQASKVKPRAGTGLRTELSVYRSDLIAFALDLLTVLHGNVSLALNRLAISQASRDDFRLGETLLERGRNPIRARARSLIEIGVRSGHLNVADLDAATRTFYGLIVGDAHVSLLLGASKGPTEDDLAHIAEQAVSHFFKLFLRSNTL